MKALRVFLYSSLLHGALVNALPLAASSTSETTPDPSASTAPGVDYSQCQSYIPVGWADYAFDYNQPSVYFQMWDYDPYKGRFGYMNGGYWKGTVDTTSVGLVIPRPPDGTDNWGITDAKIQNGYPGRRYMKSSNQVYDGYWVKLWVGMRGSDGSMTNHVMAYATKDAIPVLVVTSVYSCAGAWSAADNNCDAQGKLESSIVTDPAAVTNIVKPIVGVGITSGPKFNKYPEDLGESNPFAVTYYDQHMKQANCNGYIFTHDGVMIGLTAENTQLFKTRKLGGAYPAWMSPYDKRIEKINGVKVGSQSYSVKFDISQHDSVLKLKPGRKNPTSQNIRLFTTSGQTMALLTPDDGSRVELIPSSDTRTKPNLVIGGYALQVNDYMFDRTNGYIGFRPYATRYDMQFWLGM